MDCAQQCVPGLQLARVGSGGEVELLPAPVEAIVQGARALLAPTTDLAAAPDPRAPGVAQRPWVTYVAWFREGASAKGRVRGVLRALRARVGQAEGAGPESDYRGVFGAPARAYLQFRCGGFGLQVDRGRMARPVVPFARRVCTRCGLGVVEDALHVLWECPSYGAVRQRHSAVFQAYGEDLASSVGVNGGVPPSVSARFWAFLQQDHRQLAWLVYALLLSRAQVVGPSLVCHDGHLDSLSSDEVDLEVFEDTLDPA